jgi:hypothetical protein
MYSIFRPQLFILQTVCPANFPLYSDLVQLLVKETVSHDFLPLDFSSNITLGPLFHALKRLGI